MRSGSHASCVVDTHVWVYALTGADQLLGRKARRVLAGAAAAHVPAICQWEVAMLIAQRRIAVDGGTEAWLDAAGATEPFVVHPLTAAIAATSTELADEGFHADPADRLIYATARVLDLPLITGDERIRTFEARGPRNRTRHVIWG